MREISSEVQVAAAKLMPVGVMTAATEAGWGPSEWMYALTAVYVVLQAVYLVWKWRREYLATEAFKDSLK